MTLQGRKRIVVGNLKCTARPRHWKRGHREGKVNCTSLYGVKAKLFWCRGNNLERSWKKRKVIERTPITGSNLLNLYWHASVSICPFSGEAGFAFFFSGSCSCNSCFLFSLFLILRIKTFSERDIFLKLSDTTPTINTCENNGAPTADGSAALWINVELEACMTNPGGQLR